MLKKVILILLCCITLLFADTSAYAFNAVSSVRKRDALTAVHRETISLFTGSNAEQITVKTLRDLDGNFFEIAETGGKGYYIFDIVSGKYLEKSPDAPSPYLGLSDNLYYFGPMNYYQKIGGIFKHTVLLNENDLILCEAEELQSDFDRSLANSRIVKNHELLKLLSGNSLDVSRAGESAAVASATAADRFIPFYKYIQDDPYPANTTDVCGYTAACILLSYWNEVNLAYGRGRIIAPEFLDRDGYRLKTSGYTLKDELLSYGYPTSSTGKIIRDVIVEFCNTYGVKANVSFYLLNTNVFNEINAGRPVIVFGAGFPDTSRGHAVVAYGIHQVNSLVANLIVHYGWDKEYNKVYLDSGLIASSTQFMLC